MKYWQAMENGTAVVTQNVKGRTILIVRGQDLKEIKRKLIIFARRHTLKQISLSEVVERGKRIGGTEFIDYTNCSKVTNC